MDSVESMEIVDAMGESLSLPDRFRMIPLEALRISSRKKLSKYLNIPADVVDDDTGHVNDYMGLGELIGFDYLEIKNFERQKDPTEDLLEAWTQRPELRPTVGNLWNFLIELGRLDVIQDCKGIITNDVERFIEKRQRLENDYKPVQEATVTQSTETAPDHHVDETLILSRDDVTTGRPQMYDAFICYNPEGDDVKFVKDMISVLEKPPHSLKLFVPWRDDLPGAARFVIDAKLIESRCKRMVIIMSRNYIKSSACDFQVKFAHALSPGARSKKLIPVLIEQHVAIPQILRHVTLCDFTKQDLMEWFWDRLAKAIKAPLDPEKPSNVSSSLMESDCQSEDSFPAHGVEFETSGHHELRDQLMDSGVHSMSCSPSDASSSRISGESSSSGSFCGSLGSSQEHYMPSSSSVPSFGNNSGVVYDKTTAVIRPVQQTASALSLSSSPTSSSTSSSTAKRVINFFQKKKKHLHNTSSHA